MGLGDPTPGDLLPTEPGSKWTERPALMDGASRGPSPHLSREHGRGVAGGPFPLLPSCSWSSDAPPCSPQAGWLEELHSLTCCSQKTHLWEGLVAKGLFLRGHQLWPSLGHSVSSLETKQAPLLRNAEVRASLWATQAAESQDPRAQVALDLSQSLQPHLASGAP